MKLMIFLTCISVHVSAHVFSQKVSLNLKNVSIATVLKEVENQSNVRFVYSSDILTNLNNVTINTNEKSVKSVLRFLLNKSDLQYSESANHLIVISKKQEIIVTGTVRNENS